MKISKRCALFFFHFLVSVWNVCLFVCVYSFIYTKYLLLFNKNKSLFAYTYQVSFWFHLLFGWRYLFEYELGGNMLNALFSFHHFILLIYFPSQYSFITSIIIFIVIIYLFVLNKKENRICLFSIIIAMN